MSLNDSDLHGQSTSNGSEFQDRMRSELNNAGSQAFDTLKHWIAEGNARRLVIRRGDQDLVQLPLTVVVVATLIAPQLMALGFVVAIISGCSLEVRHNR